MNMKRSAPGNIPTLEDIDEFVKELCESAGQELQALMQGCSDLEFWPKAGEPMNESHRRMCLALSRLQAISIIHQHDNIDVSQTRGVQTTYGRGRGDWGQPVAIKLNGQGSARIRLWSGREEYSDNPREMSTTASR